MATRTMLAGAVFAVLVNVAGVASDQFRASIDSRLVLIPVTVTDRNGKSLTGLQQHHFQVFDDAEPRPIVSLAREDAPVSFGVILDLSGSMRNKVADAVAAVRAIVDVAQAEDDGFLITFADRPELRSGFTANVGSFPAMVRHIEPAGDTALIDAVYLGLHQLKSARNPRRALIVISDGGDNRSRYTSSELMDRAVESDAQIYTIGLFDDIRSMTAKGGIYLLDKLSSATGGVHFVVRRSSALPEQAARLAEAMKNLYVIGYHPPVHAEPGKWRKVRVTVTHETGKSVRVTSRSSYLPPG